ncbi:hypothetical protein JCM10908_007071 [Rhodotorula pacifica]|uniref:uncharacterized protein n=1 Tax=Rhodotorula pacifica TaxID=1495444 RepID=UPI0031702AA9
MQDPVETQRSRGEAVTGGSQYRVGVPFTPQCPQEREEEEEGALPDDAAVGTIASPYAHDVADPDGAGTAPMQSSSTVDEPSQGINQVQAPTSDDGAGATVEGSDHDWKPRSDLHESPYPREEGNEQTPPTAEEQHAGIASRIRGLTPNSARQVPISLRTFCVMRNDPPPMSHTPYEYMVVLPFRTLGAMIIGTSGRTKRSICDQSRLVDMRVLFTTDGKCFLHLFGSKGSIEAALAQIRDLVFKTCYWKLNEWERHQLDRRDLRWIEWSDRNAEKCEGAWLKDHYADTPRNISWTSASEAREPPRYSEQGRTELRGPKYAQRHSQESLYAAPSRAGPSRPVVEPGARRSRTPSPAPRGRSQFRSVPLPTFEAETTRDLRQPAAKNSVARSPATFHRESSAAINEGQRNLWRSPSRSDPGTPPRSSREPVWSANMAAKPETRRTTNFEGRDALEETRREGAQEGASGVGRATYRSAEMQNEVSIPAEMVMRFVGTTSCASYVEYVTGSRLKIEIVSGTTKIRLEGGDIGKAREMIKEVLQKERGTEVERDNEQTQSSSPFAEQPSRKRDCSPVSPIEFNRASPSPVRQAYYPTPDTSFGKQPVITRAERSSPAEMRERELRQAAYERVAKRKRTDDEETVTGAPAQRPAAQDRRASERVQNWVESVRQEQSQQGAERRRLSYDSRTSESVSCPSGHYRYEDRYEADSRAWRRSERDTRRQGPLDREAYRPREHARESTRRPEARPPLQPEAFRRNDRRRDSPDRWTKGSRWEPRETESRVRGVGWGANGWHQTYSSGRERRGRNR